MELEKLDALLTLLKKHQVYSFKDGDLELSFYSQLENRQIVFDETDKSIKQGPVDLTTDPVTSMDQILNWSSPQFDETLPLPLTNDDPVAEHHSEDAS